MTWSWRALIPPAVFTSLVASWMPRSLEVPKVASVPVIDPTSPMTMGPFAPAPAAPLRCSFLQPNVAATTHTRSFAEMRRMGGSVRGGKGALLNIVDSRDQPPCRHAPPIVGSERVWPAHPRRRRQPGTPHAFVVRFRGSRLRRPDGGQGAHRPGSGAQGSAGPRAGGRAAARSDGLRRG